ncbi:MAG: polysaccharide deacetylase family protein [bacterium]
MLPWKYPSKLTQWLLPDAIFRLNAADGSIYLTFDDGPDPEVTSELLALLAEYRAKATFFVVYSDEPWWAEQIEQIDSRGHCLALHGMRHRSGYLLPNLRLKAELTELNQRLERAGVKPLPAYRPPFGHIRPDTIRFLKRSGIATVLWTHIPGDFRSVNSERLFERLNGQVQPGDIVVLHDGVKIRPAPVLGLTRLLLEHIRSRGWRTEMLPSIRSLA